MDLGEICKDDFWSIIVIQLSIRYLQLQLLDSWNIKYIGLLVESISLVLLMALTEVESRKGFVTSGIQTFYWFLSSTSGIVLLYSKLMAKNQNEDMTEQQLLQTYLVTCMVQFIFTWFPDIDLDTVNERDCGFAKASFLQRIFFVWFNGFMSTGAEKTIEEDDMCDMMPEDQTENKLPVLEQTWKAEQKKLESKGSASASAEVDLFKVLVKSNWASLLTANVLKFIVLIPQQCNPLVTGLLVGFAYDMDQPMWKGYVYVLAGFLCISINRILNCYLHFLGRNTGLGINACLKNFVFKKAMRLSNKARSESTAGEISNMLSNDCNQVQVFMAHLFWSWCVVLEFCISFTIVYSTVSYAAFAGIAVLLVVMPLNAYMAKKGHNTHLAKVEKRDERSKLMTEILNGIKILKLYAWEMAFGDRILDIRKEEINILRKQRLFSIIGTICWCIAPFLMGFLTFVLYVYISPDHMLTPTKAFQSLATFGALTHTFNAMPHVLFHILRSLVSIKRIQKFLNSEELDDSAVSHEKADDAITIEKGTFSWDEKLGPCLKDINVSIPKGSLTAIVGSVGSGKSSLLSAMLGEMEKDEGKVNIDGHVAYVSQQAWIYNETIKNNILFSNDYHENTYNDVIDACCLQRDLDILVARDETEIGEKGINLSGGQKQRVNIARAVYFNSDIYLLDDPLSAVDVHVGKGIFEKVIGENGLLQNKTRILVTHGISWLPRVDKILCMEDGRITESGTYNELMANGGDFAKFIQKHKKDGNTSDSSDDEENIVSVTETMKMPNPKDLDVNIIEDLLNCQPTSPVIHDCTELGYGFPTEAAEIKKTIGNKVYGRSISRSFAIEKEKKTDSPKPTKKLKRKTTDDKFKLNEKRIKLEEGKCSDGKIIEDDELETGEVQMKYIVPYLKSIGYIVCLLVLTFVSMEQICDNAKGFWIKEWTGDESLNNVTMAASDSELRAETNAYYIRFYLVIGVFHCISVLTRELLLSYGVLRGAWIMHENMLKNILRGPMTFFDSNPVGRIVNRFSSDLEPLDGGISHHLMITLDCIYGFIAVFVVMLTTIPKFFILVLPLVYLCHGLKKQFVPVRRQLARITSKQRSPFYSHFSECLNGVHVIRAYDMTEKLTQQSAEKYSALNRSEYHIRVMDFWLSMRFCVMNTLCFTVCGFLALTNREYLGAATVGLIISYVLSLGDSMESIVRMFGELEHNVVCVERIVQFTEKAQEAPLHTSVIPDKSWPAHGKVDIENYSMRYKDNDPLVLQDISVDIKPGEKIGIVGKTGAGKSSLTLGLFRLVEPADGKIVIDKHDISDLGVFDLRSNLIILPQDPTLFCGTLRSNLDPFNVCTDEEIYEALKHAHLKSFIDTLPDKLKYDCGEGGKNLSVGQRQLICLARALLRKSHVLVLDEATAAVDMETDTLIQGTIKNEFKHCTVLTIAHRLNTIIDYDRILVLDHGKVIEFDSPNVLLEDKSTVFYSMAKQAGLVK
ncbi:Multidrug resistance-associated protein 1 [Mactra antiquata]